MCLNFQTRSGTGGKAKESRRLYFRRIGLQHTLAEIPGCDPHGLFEGTAEIERVVKAYKGCDGGDIHGIGGQQILGLFDPQIDQVMHGRHLHPVLEGMGKVSLAQLTVIGHGGDRPFIHVMLIDLDDQPVDGKIIFQGNQKLLAGAADGRKHLIKVVGHNVLVQVFF